MTKKEILEASIKNPDSKEEQEEDEDDLKEVPANDLDFQFSMIEPGFQRPKKGFKNKLKTLKGTKYTYEVDEKGTVITDDEGNPIIEKQEEVFEDLSGYLQFWGRDFRLGNLSMWSGEYEYVIKYVSLAADLLTEGFPRPCLAALNKAASRLELSSSKAAKLRELIQTIRKVSITGSQSQESERPSVSNVAKKYI